MKKPSMTHSERLEPLFTLDLQFQWEMSPVTSRMAGEGEYIGSGDGTVEGTRIHGKVTWDLFEKREERLCRSNLTGLIKTDDGAHIQFDSRGFFIQPDESNPNKWITSASVHFDTGEPRYTWINTHLALWEGEFDMATFHHHYQVYLQIVE